MSAAVKDTQSALRKLKAQKNSIIKAKSAPGQTLNQNHLSHQMDQLLKDAPLVHEPAQQTTRK